MIEGVGVALASMFAAYCIYEIGVMVWVMRKYPDRKDDGELIIGRQGRIEGEFLARGGSTTRYGFVEVNGTRWSAELGNADVELRPGDDCLVVGREGLTLFVDRVDASPGEQQTG